MNRPSPFFIVFEGIDGSGKSTLCGELCRALEARGIPPLMLSEPTGGRWGREIRKLLRGRDMPDPEEQLRLFILDREEDARENIRPALERGRNVVMDRYYFSNAAYQGAAGIPPERIIAANRERGFPEPQRVYLVDLDPDEALRRIAKRNGGPEAGDAFERAGFLAEVRRLYRSIADERFLVIDGSKPARKCLEDILEDMENTFGIR